MSRCVDLDEKVTAQFYDQEFEEWTMRTVTIEDVLDSVCDEYTVLPSAQPERIRGRWGTTVASPALIVCNRCGRTVLKNGSVHWNFCPNCGADMRGEDE